MDRSVPGYFALGMVLFLAGCRGGNKPDSFPVPRYPVMGKAMRGSSPITSGQIIFTPVKNSELQLSVEGEIQKDGGFSMSSQIGEDKVIGVPAGDYSVTLKTASDSAKLSKIIRVQKADNFFSLDFDN